MRRTARQTCFNDVLALTRYLYFASWQALIKVMFTQLELATNAPTPLRKRAKRRVSPRRHVRSRGAPL